MSTVPAPVTPDSVVLLKSIARLSVTGVIGVSNVNVTPSWMFKTMLSLVTIVFEKVVLAETLTTPDTADALAAM